ncbi:unnamed protein product [Agarophyton chilense]
MKTTEWWYVPQLHNTHVEALRRYKYSGEDRSVLRRYVMNDVYERVVYAFPPWVAPNSITLGGLLLVVLSHAQLLYYSVDLSRAAPRGAYALAAITLFSYMVLDNLDGKQARRTNSSSALGQLFDHGCDALNVTLSGMSMLAAMQAGCDGESMLLLLVLGHAMLFMATVEEYVTGSMVLRAINGPNEGIVLLCVMYALTAAAGPSVWHRRVHDAIALRRVATAMALLASTHAVVGNIIGMVQHARRRGLHARHALCNALQLSQPLLLHSALFLGTAVAAPRVFARCGVALMWMAGAAMFDVVTRVMLAHLARCEFPRASPLLVPAAVACGAVVGAERGVVGMCVAHAVVAGALGGAAAYNAWRACCVLRQLCDAMRVRCFSLKRG